MFAVGTLLGSTGLSSCGDAPVTLRSTRSSQLVSLSVAHDGRYRIAYDLNQCAGTRFVIRNTTIGGLSAPLPNEIVIVTSDRNAQHGSTDLSLYHGSWQVDDSDGKAVSCTWTMTVSRISS
jgi:hypothetical protein